MSYERERTQGRDVAASRVREPRPRPREALARPRSGYFRMPLELRWRCTIAGRNRERKFSAIHEGSCGGWAGRLGWVLRRQEVSMMSPRRSGQGEPEPRRFTPARIDSGIRKLKRRIEEVTSLDPRAVRFDDARVENASRNIRADIIEIFGDDSQEYFAHGAHSIGNPQSVAGMDDDEYQHYFAEELPNTLLMLEGLIKRLEEKREDLGGGKTALAQASFEGLDLHPRITSACAELYRNQHYRNAVLDASLALQDYVKERSRCRERDGADLMRYVFSANNPIVAFNGLADETDRSEQEGMMHLFEGVMLALRNPRAHTLSDDSPEQALKYIALMSLLAKRL